MVSVQATFAATLVDEWVHAGVTDAVICPGSRSTPMALALAARLNVHVRLDERSAGFFALGLSMATGRPTIICVTSGTAAAELHPAVVESHQGRVPLIVCTADRPPEMHHVGASQTIDQVGLFTTSTRWACDPGVPEESQARSWRPLASRAFAEAQTGPLGPGPVHLNLAFRDPLVGDVGPLPSRPGPASVAGTASTVSLEAPLSGRGMIIAGANATDNPAQLLLLGARLGWPILADPRSGCRIPGTIAAADAIVRAPARPELPSTVVLLGAHWLSKALGEYVAEAAAQGARVISVDPWRQWTDPTVVVTEFHHVAGEGWIEAALEGAAPSAAASAGVVASASASTRASTRASARAAISAATRASARAATSAATSVSASSVDLEWLEKWQGHEVAAQAAIDRALGQGLSEPLVARVTARHASADDLVLMVSASMPMRDLEWFAPTLEAPPTVKANRGANGIDGVVSTALGIAASGRRTMALLGDLAFLHDVSGLVNLPEVPCTFVVLDNGGGGIFSFLPQAAALDHDRFELLFGTPPGSDVGDVARGFGLDVREVTTRAQLEAALDATAASAAPSVVRVTVGGREGNVALHDAINRAVSDALA